MAGLADDCWDRLKSHYWPMVNLVILLYVMHLQSFVYLVVFLAYNPLIIYGQKEFNNSLTRQNKHV